MKVTLERLCDAKEVSPFDILKVKKSLIEFKKAGRVFFDVEIGSLGYDTEFELYYHVLPSEQSDKNAFPVPLSYFQLHKNEFNRFHYLKEFFESYYKGEELDHGKFYDYDKQKPFIGNDYVWYYKRTEGFS